MSKPRFVEKFEARLHGDELELAHRLMAQAGLSKKAEFTRASILAGAPAQDFLRDNRLGELAMAANRLAGAIEAGPKDEGQRRLMAELKRLIKMVHKAHVADRQMQGGRS